MQKVQHTIVGEESKEKREKFEKICKIGLLFVRICIQYGKKVKKEKKGAHPI